MKIIVVAFQKSVIAKPVRTLAAAIRSPKAPLRKGKSPKRCQWQKKRGDFEEVPRLAATIVAGNRLARRWAGCHGEAVTEGSTHRTPCAHKCLRRLPFFHQRKKGRKERRQNQWFWIPCAGTVQNISGPFDPANHSAQTCLVLSHRLRLYSPRRAPRLCCLGITGLPPASTVRRDVSIAPYEILSANGP